MSNFNNDFDRDFKRAGAVIGAIWLLSALVSLALTGVVIWAVIALVTHLTT